MKFIDLGFKRGQVLAFKIRGLKAKETGRMSPFYKNGDECANRKKGGADAASFSRERREWFATSIQTESRGMIARSGVH